MYSLAFTLILMTGYVTCTPKANYYVENVLRGPLQKELRNGGLWPASLSDFSTEFEDKVFIIGKVKGKANYTNGLLYGLNDTRRSFDCLGPSYSFGTGTVNCTISLSSLRSEYKGTVKYGKLPKFDIKARANITNTILDVVFVQYQNQVPQVGKFQIYEMGQVQPKFTGLGSALNKYMKVLENGYKTHVSAVLFNSLQNFQVALNRAAGQMPF